MCTRRPRKGVPALLISVILTILWFPALAAAVPRSFYMALYFGNDPRATDLAWFFPGAGQPERRAILDISSAYLAQSNFQTYITGLGYDWTRIAAVVIDEPYSDLTPNNDNCPDAFDQVNIALRETKVAQAASVITALSPSTRFWVNFSQDEIYALRHCPSPPQIYRPYIDVVSLDRYDVSFQGIRADYEWLLANKPNLDLQLALVPATFHKPDNPHQLAALTAAAWLEGYFAYADEANAGNLNRPVVWLIAGFPADTAEHPGVGTFYGHAAPGSEAIAEAWAQRWSRKPWPWTAPVILSLF